MRSYDYEALTYDGAVYCKGCLPAGVDPQSNEVMPVFADSEWDYYPACDKCGKVHDYVNLTPEGRAYEKANKKKRSKARGQHRPRLTK